MNQDPSSKMYEFLEAINKNQDTDKMNQDTDKMYKFLEDLNICGPPKSLTVKKTKSDTRDKQFDSPSNQNPSYQGSKKCDDQCVDCFSVFCHK